ASVHTTSWGSSSTRRIFLISMVLVSISGWVLFGEGKVKGRAAVNHAFPPSLAAVPVDDALDIGQPDARALKLVLAVQALKHAEKFAGVLGIETGAVVANEDH